MTGHPLPCQLTFNDHLSCDARVVGTHLPEGVVPLHPAEPDQGVHDGVVEPMAHVKAARHIRGRNHDREWSPLPGGGKVPRLFPILVPAFFDRVGFVSLIHGISNVNRPFQGRQMEGQRSLHDPRSGLLQSMCLDFKTLELIGLVTLAASLFCGLILIHQLGNTAESLITFRNDI